MRYLLVAMLLATTIAPATAASRASEDADMARAAAKLNDPAMQSALSGMMVAMADMLMDVRVDKLRAAVAKVDPEARDDSDWDGVRTVGDMMRRDDPNFGPNFRDNLANGSRRALGTMGAMATGMAEMMPEFRAMAERMGRQVDEAMRRMPRD